MVPTLQILNESVIVAFLVCFPNASIQTRQVRTTGDGIFTLGQHHQSLGNLNLAGVNDLLNSVLSNFTTTSGPVQ
jgi:hypothetical protein